MKRSRVPAKRQAEIVLISGLSGSGKSHAANALEEAIKTNNISDIKAKTEVLNNAWNEASTKMYESAKAGDGPQSGGPQPGPGAQQQQGGGDGGKKVENADFEVVDDK